MVRAPHPVAEDLILCGCRWVDNWAIIQRLVPSADTIFELGTASRRLDDLGLTPIEERIVTGRGRRQGRGDYCPRTGIDRL